MDFKALVYSRHDAVSQIRTDKSEFQKFMAAIKVSDVTTLCQIGVAHPGMLQCCNKWGKTPLAIAMKWTIAPEIVQTLLELGAKANDGGGNKTPLYLLMTFNYALNPKVARAKMNLLLAAGAKIQSHRESVLMGAVMMLEIVDEYHTRHDKSCRCLEPIDFLIQCGADPYFIDDSDSSLLHYVRCVNVADLLIKSYGLRTNFRNSLGETPMHRLTNCVAPEAYIIDCLDLFFSHGGDVEILDNCGNSLLHRACCNDIPEVVTYIMTQIKDINGRNLFGRSPLHMSVTWINMGLQTGESEEYRPEILRILLDNGALVSSDVYGISPFHLACMNKDEKCASLLLEKDSILVKATDRYGSTALMYHICSKVFDADFLKYLLDYGCDVNAQDTFGSTALHYAVYQKNVIAYQLLLKYEANFRLTDQEGRTPLELAERLERQEFMLTGRQYEEPAALMVRESLPNEGDLGERVRDFISHSRRIEVKNNRHPIKKKFRNYSRTSRKYLPFCRPQFLKETSD